MALTAATSSRARARRTGLRSVLDWFVVVAIALGAATLVRVFVFQQYTIDGSSMAQTLTAGDRVLVNKLSYRLHDVRRGDVVVFDRVTTSGTVVQHDDLIKRVIGLPGETVSIQSCDVFVDGRLLDEPYLAPELRAAGNPAARCGAIDVAPLRVPDGEVFVMGDNRPASLDSRAIGPISIDLIRGRAFVVLWPLGNWRWL